MKIFSKLFLIAITISSCSSTRYLLSDSNEDKNFLNQKIKEYKNTEGISNKPLIVIDGMPYRFTHELKDNTLELSKSDIEKIDVLKKDAGLRIYGEFAEGGVIVITTKNYTQNENGIVETPSNKIITDSNVLFLLNGKEISKYELEKIDANNILSVTVLKDQKEIKKYTSKNYEGVIIIELKK